MLKTTAATALGHFPLVLVTGAGAEVRNSIGIGIILVAGMMIGTVFTLFVLPCVYAWLARDYDEESHSYHRLVPDTPRCNRRIAGEARRKQTDSLPSRVLKSTSSFIHMIC